MITISPDRILIIRRQALGDTLATLPAITQLRELFGRARIDLIVDDSFAHFIDESFTGVNVLPYPGSIRNWPQFIRSQNYDIVIDYLGFARTAFWTFYSGASIRVGYNVRFRKWAYNYRVDREQIDNRLLYQFAGESFIDLTRLFCKYAEPWEHETVSDVTSAKSDSYQSWESSFFSESTQYIGVSLSATGSSRAWHGENAGQLFELLAESGLKAFLIPGPSDNEIVKSVLGHNSNVVVAPDTNLAELKSLLSKIDLLISTDNGTRHVAMLVDKPTLTMFGPTDSGGWNRKHFKNGIVKNHVSCSPCNLWECNVDGHPCMEELTANQVFDKAKEMLTTFEVRGSV
ncbi:MAG: glycosyltransferase family 9 protein [bacterium]|nr:glycosyltransferase family 9 protein [bacterium]MCP4800265.1 glycosyltransferase family 9 protein [bacterium]